MIGLELLWNASKGDFVSKNDAVVTVIHYCLLQNGYRSIGTGESFLLTDDTAAGGEVLPQNWNRDQTGYVIRYIKGDPGPGRRKLVVKAVPMGTNMLLCTFLESPGEKTAELTLTPEFLTTDYRDYSKAFAQPDSVETVKNQFDKQVISHLNEPTTLDQSRLFDQRSESGARPGPQRPRPGPPSAPDWEEDLNQPRRFPPQVGGADLDPFHRGIGGGGMLMDPRELHGSSGRFRGPNPGTGPFGSGPHLPPGSLPPGARFDPFGPPGPRGGPWPRGPNFGNPDPDHERPPDYDDIFM